MDFLSAEATDHGTNMKASDPAADQPSRSPWGAIAPWFERVRQLLEDSRLRWRVFGRTASLLAADDVRGTITTVAFVNAVLAGVPGKLGVGVLVCQALELWMAWRIARHVGVDFASPGALWKAIASWGGVLFLVLSGMRFVINMLSTLLSVVPLPPVAIAELLATDAMGVLFWIGFEEMARTDTFAVPLRTLGRAGSELKQLARYQLGRLRAVLSPRRIKAVGGRLKAFLRGDHLAPPTTTLDAVVAGSMASLVVGNQGALDGPLGGMFLHSIRDLYPDLASADQATIAARMADYDDGQMAGVLANIKGRLFERMIEARTNAAAGMSAELHPDRSHPGTDIVVHDTGTGESFEVSLKATDDAGYVERALARYPEDRVWATDEAAAKFDDPRVEPTGVLDADLEAVTKENFDKVLHATPPGLLDEAGFAARGSALAAAVTLWPFCAARPRGRIDDAQWKQALHKILGKAAVRAVVNFAGLTVLGPLYAWYLLARVCVRVSQPIGHAT